VKTPCDVLDLLGLVYWGDLGAITLYRDQRGQRITFAKTRPRTPPTPRQAAARFKVTSVAACWRALPPSTRTLYRRLAQHLSLPFSGYNLWQHHRHHPEYRTIDRLARLCGRPATDFLGPIGNPIPKKYHRGPFRYVRPDDLTVIMHPWTATRIGWTEHIWFFPIHWYAQQFSPIELIVKSDLDRPIEAGVCANLWPCYLRYHAALTPGFDTIWLGMQTVTHRVYAAHQFVMITAGPWF